MASTPDTLDTLRAEAQQAAGRAHVPYSGRPAAAVLLLEDGTWVPGVRVESAAFSLTIPPLLNAFTTAMASERRDVVAAVLSRPARPEEQVFLNALEEGPFEQAGSYGFVRAGPFNLPGIGEVFSPFLDAAVPEDAEAGVALARAVAQRAHVPASRFRVGCVLMTAEGRLLPGVNVEHEDWSQILCAERNALGTAVTYGLADGLRALYLSCPDDPDGSPCGACRQLLVELAPQAVLWMDRHEDTPEAACPPDLLPGSFDGKALLRSAHL